MNLEKWQGAVAKILLEFANAGRFVVLLNGHRWFQVIAVSHQRSEVIVMERAKLTENSLTRSRMMDNVVHLLQHLSINIDDVDFVMDVLSNGKLSNIGRMKHPIYSTGSKHLKRRLLQCFEMYDIIDKTNRMPKFIADGYKVIRDLCRVVTYEEFNKRCHENSQLIDHLHSECDLAAIGGDFSKVISDKEMIEFFPDPKRRAGMRVVYQNAFNCIQLVEALDSNNKADFIHFSKAFLQLVNPEKSQCQDLSTGKARVPDLMEAADSIKRLCKLADTESDFSLSYFNIALDYEVSDTEFTAEILTKGKVLPTIILQKSYEPVIFNTPLKIRPVLDSTDKVTIAQVIKRSAMQS